MGKKRVLVCADCEREYDVDAVLRKVDGDDRLFCNNVDCPTMEFGEIDTEWEVHVRDDY